MQRAADIAGNNSNIGGILATDGEMAEANLLEIKGKLQEYTTGERQSGGTLVTANAKIRAEPIAALYERGRVLHVPGLHKLESELLSFSRDFENKAASPNRMDAAIWGLERLRQVKHVTMV